MRVAARLILASAVTVAMASAAWSQTPAAKPAAAPPAAAAPAAQPAAAPAPQAAAAAAPKQAPQPARAACSNQGALGVARTVEIDTTGGPGFGFEHFKELDFLRDKEVVLTFDDGPWPKNTPAVLKALADECTTGIFFPIGKHATYEPEILKQVYAAGHTVGSHTWSHANLNNKKLTEQQRKEEIEKGFSAVKWALGGVAPSPFFRFPALQHPPEMVTYLGNRNIGIFSCDIDSFDFKASKPEKIVDTVMKKLDSKGKGILLMHDFQKHTAEALPALLQKLKAGGYKVVAMRAKAPVATLPEYDQELLKDVKLPTVSQRPVNSVVTTVSE
ncbi:polysaccharide deacetylase family protein [Bradyrhizobium manausense]|uniref:polysaccharide deacetylase family protein n=1 Tax=Bradyrhizobium TaxID=374 RepID=UPI001BAA5242|nr:MULTISPECIES: polysaccharide deacetylase family protein [Bradyrhizobium]MBR0828035.1 polysaccharide deacetylase family protein [Bradyrhizobium manausense]UVO33314.1 polysaccharide deacetylase family protein [Bradyrhizobium arachidis]